MGEEVIMLSIEESNTLRVSLGLKPLLIKKNYLKVVSESKSGIANESSTLNDIGEETSLSFDESNDLRISLGLKPLNNIRCQQPQSGRKESKAIHKPAQNTGEKGVIQKRLEESKLKREVEAGIAELKRRNDEAIHNHDGENIYTWADQMRKNESNDYNINGKRKKKSNPLDTKKTSETKKKNYTDTDFKDQNLTVAHSMSEFKIGSTTILTLADKSLLDTEEDNQHTLEDINLSERAGLEDRVKQKRMLELGMGHAGAYVGYDDEEFEEYGGSEAITPGMKRSDQDLSVTNSQQQKNDGFKLYGHISQPNDEKKQYSDTFNAIHGQSISLETSQNKTIHQTDFMSYEEEESLWFGGRSVSKISMEKKRKKKDKKNDEKNSQREEEDL